MISEDDTEDWRNDDENSVLHHRNQLYSKVHSNKNLFFIEIIFQKTSFFQYFCSNRYSLDEQNTFFKNITNLTDPKLWAAV